MRLEKASAPQIITGIKINTRAIYGVYWLVCPKEAKKSLNHTGIKINTRAIYGVYWSVYLKESKGIIKYHRY